MNMENQKEMCGGGMCGHGGACGHGGMCGHGHHIMKWLFKLIVIMLVFCLGFEMGELKGMLRSSEMHHGFYGASPMMYGVTTDSSWGNDGVISGSAQIISPTTNTPGTPKTK